MDKPFKLDEYRDRFLRENESVISWKSRESEEMKLSSLNLVTDPNLEGFVFFFSG